MKKVSYKDIERIPKLKINTNFKSAFQGSSPAPFIGRYGYPNINIGVLSPQFIGNTINYDSPNIWTKENTTINQIANLRSSLVNTRTKSKVQSVNRPSRLLNVCQEVGMAKNPVDLEVQLKSVPRLFRCEKEVIPFGPQGELKKIQVTENAKVDTRVEKVVYDTYFKASPAIVKLYKKGFEDNFLTKLLSVGNLGIKKNRRLVPTRWSITATDDIIGKNLIEQVKDYPIANYQTYFGSGWGNYYLVLIFPEVWSYELFEMYVDYKKNPWSKSENFYSTDYENYSGRKEYAKECAGGYYATRISVLEKLKEIKRQGSCLVLRFITSEYNTPLGVWVCRQASRKTLQMNKISFATKELMLNYAKLIAKKKFGVDLSLLLENSKLIKNIKLQRKLFEF